MTTTPHPSPTGRFIADCRARIGFDLLTRTWTVVVLFGLREGPRRPGELRAAIGGISAKVLNETLRRLEDDGLVERHRYAEAPPRVEYALTALGRTLLGPSRRWAPGASSTATRSWRLRSSPSGVGRQPVTAGHWTTYRLVGIMRWTWNERQGMKPSARLPGKKRLDERRPPARTRSRRGCAAISTASGRGW